MFKKPEDRNPRLYVIERLAGMGWLLATDTIHLSFLKSEGRHSWFRADTKFDSAEFEFLMPKSQGCFGTLSSDDLQWTKAEVEQTRDAIELDAMRCYAVMYALEQYIMSVPYGRQEVYVKIGWSDRAGYTVLISPAVREVGNNPWIIVLAPNFEVTAMVENNA